MYLFITIPVQFIFWHNLHNVLSTRLLGYLQTYVHQILMLLLWLRTNTYLSPQLLVYLPLNVPDHDPAISFSYFKYSIWLTAQIYPSTFFCSVFLPFRRNIHAHQLGTYTQIQPEINVPVYLHTSPLSNNTDLPVTTNTCVPAHRWPYLLGYLHTRK